MLEMLWFGFIVMVIGMLVVFVGLILLIWSIQLMSKLCAKTRDAGQSA